MPRLTDPAAIRALLETDRRWTVYALGDLSPERFPHCEWFSAKSATPVLVLLYREFGTPVFLSLGEPPAVQALLDEIGEVPRMDLQIRTDILPLIKARYQIQHEAYMWRMILDVANYRPAPATNAVRLGPADVPVLQRLYADGEPTGEAPGAFFPSMLADGVFFGIWEGSELIAAAGTHMVVPAEGIGAIGNVYTRRDRRGHGLATSLTSAVASELLRGKLRTVALNVNQRNTAAIRVYERLGFVRYCAFNEGLAVGWNFGLSRHVLSSPVT